MFESEKDWSKTDHPFVPELIERIKRLRGLKRAQALYGLAEAFWEEYEFVDAVEALDKAVDLFSKQNALIDVGQCHRFAGVCLRDDALYLAALERFDLARQIFLDAGFLYDVADCDAFAAFVLHLMLRTDDALKRLDAAQAIFMESGRDDGARLCLRLRTQILNGT